MVSTWRFYSFKDLSLRSRHPFQLFVLIGVFLIVLWYYSGYLLFFIAITYMLSGIMTRVSTLFRRRPAGPASAAYEEAPEPR
jgi:CDP-diacylglycerol---serine O-phosphatidyltransferase